MNKELIKKYKAEFDHMLDGGKLLHCYDSNFLWYSSGVGIWNMRLLSNNNITHIVINDEYAEFRKALAEGKTIQWCFGDDGWKDYPYFDNEVKHYRIKPDEPKFKVGDWVTQVDGIPFQFKENTCYLGLSLWTPQPNEWCCFWDNDYRHFEVGKFVKSEKGSHYFDDGTINRDNIQPYTGPVPKELA